VTAPVWLLPSVGRPQAAQDVLDACAEMGMTQQGFLYADGDDYTGVKLPANWMLIQRDENHGIGPAMNDIFAGFPFASHYGWLADDTEPRTPGFDELLTTAAGGYGLAYANDGGYRSTPEFAEAVEKGDELTSGLVWAGDLVRAAGWWALPGLRQAYVDVVWCELIAALGLARYAPWVVVEHMQWRIGKRERDAWDAIAESPQTPVWAADAAVYETWVADGKDATLTKLAGSLVAA
jgi:hypothetical protein